ncbi:hypothetical protein H9I32_27770 [Bacillus sp. Xin]|uniref:hypothetical protein n=1 Tax=unclassified Bacillus (in: firmicutes) TaxID=185979 RepID=UPI001572B5A0|nr:MULTISPECIES: hypothetical protein [unclassified Bacillus (in: firmicutes)]MBC6976030.1 hypothetical protein [Bacillus sp. Xin]NSW38734.1 hypothetical protein [Bacillus sp. Xin1]
MLFTDLSSPVQRSYLSDLRKNVRNLLGDMNYVVVEEDVSFITDDFVQRVFEYLEKKHFLQKWIDVEISLGEMYELLQLIEKSMRKRKSTLHHWNYFHSLLHDLRLHEDIPNDFLYMKKRLMEVENMKKQQEDAPSLTPVSTQQLNVLKKLWKRTFKRALEVTEDITQSEVDELFTKVNQKRFKIYRERRDRLWKRGI